MSWLITPKVRTIAVGGNSVYDITVSGTTYRVHEFTTVGTSTLILLAPATIEYLIVGGGGGGGGSGGGSGGTGGGGAGRGTGGTSSGTSGTDNTGGGGGGGALSDPGGPGGNGGSGIVIVRYAI